jgi:subtilisin family serine protease
MFVSRPAQRSVGLRYRLLCGTLACAFALPIPAAQAAITPYTASLQQSLEQDPAHFNDKMWALIRANPEQRDQIFHEAVRLSLQHEIALNPANKAATVAKFKQLYPDMAPTLEAYANGQTVAQAAPPLPEVMSIGAERPRIIANDPAPRVRGDWFGRNWPWVLLGGAAVAGGAVAIVAATAKSSSGDAPPAAATPGTPPTVGADQEYQNQGGLARINAAAANNAGFTGQGITVAVVDSGVNIAHADLVNQIAPGGYNFINDTATITDTDSRPQDGSFHGTHVAGIIAAEKNDFGIRGIAYNAKILPLAAIGSGAPLTAVTNAVNRASSQGAKVLNASYGPNDTVNQLFVDNSAQFFWNNALDQANAYLTAANNGMILVFAAGNSYTTSSALINNHPTGGGFLPFIRPSNSTIALGLPGAYRYSNDGVTLTTLSADYSGLEGKLIAAVSVDANNVISSFSNRCGVAKNWCIAAPGEDINSTSSGNSYTTLSGTSFSAPHVSGALAVLLQQHPELTPTQVVNLLLNTATDIGAPGIDDIYGHGLLNLGAASQSIGPFSIVTSGNLNGNSVLLNGSSVTASPAFGNQLTAALAGTEIGVLDSYTRNYTVNLGDRVTTRLNTIDGTTSLQRFGQNEFRPEIALDTSNRLNFTLKAKNALERAAGSEGLSSLASYSFTHQVGNSAAVAMSHREARAASLGFNEADRTLLAAQLAGHGAGNPYLDFVNDGYASNVTLDLPWSGRFRATTAMGAPDNDDAQRNVLAMSEADFGNAGTGVTFTAGGLIEQERVLGLQGTGAFALGEGTTTWFGGVAGRWQVAANTQLLASWYGGVTEASTNSNSLVQGADRIASMAWRVGLTQHDVLQADDRLRVNIAQPLRAESGALQVNLPQYRLRDGSIISQTASYGLAPTGREIDLEAGYSFTVAETAKLDFATLYRRDAGHVAGKHELLGLSRFSKAF